MTPHERARKVYKEYIEHHALYADDESKIVAALERAFSDAIIGTVPFEDFYSVSVEKNVIREKLASFVKANIECINKIDKLEKQLKYAIHSGNGWRDLAMKLTKNKAVNQEAQNDE